MTRAKYMLVLVAACSSSESADTPAPAGKKAPPSTTATATSPSEPPPPPPASSSPKSGEAPDAGADAAKSPKTVCAGTTNVACFDCCDQHYPAANKTFWGCFCEVGAGLCATECAKDYMCGGDQADATGCYDCFDENVATCDERLAKAREGSQEIRDYDECTAACP